MLDRADGAAGRSISLDFLRIGTRVAPVVGARNAVRTAQRLVGGPQRRVRGAQYLQHGLPIRHRRHRQVNGLHAVVVDGVDVRAAIYQTLDALDVAVRAGLRGNHASSKRPHH